MFATQSEAKGFFVEKVVSRALSEGLPLSKQEQRLIRVSVADPDSLTDLHDAAGEAAEREFESRVSGLLKRSYQADLQTSPDARNLYRDAYAKLAEGDHYLMVMIEQAIGRRLLRRGLAARVGMFVLLIVPGVVALLIAAALGWGFITNPRHGADNPQAIVAGLMFLGFGVFLAALWWRER